MLNEHARCVRIPLTRLNPQAHATLWRTHAEALILVSAPRLSAPQACVLSASVYRQFLDDLEERGDPAGHCRARVLTFDGERFRWLHFLRRGEHFEHGLLTPMLPDSSPVGETTLILEAQRHQRAWNRLG